MRATVFAIALALTAPAAATAACPSQPDGPTTGYTANQTAMVLCQQRALGDAVIAQQRRNEIDAQLQHLQQQLRLDEQLSRAHQSLPSPPLF